MSTRKPDRATQLVARILEQLAEKRSGITRVLMEWVVAYMEDSVDGDLGREEFIALAYERERVAWQQVSRLSSAAYRKILDVLDEPSRPIELPTMPDETYNWGGLYDDLANQVDLLDDLDQVVSETAEQMLAAIDEQDLANVVVAQFGEATMTRQDRIDEIIDGLSDEVFDELEREFAGANSTLRDEVYRSGGGSRIIGYRRVVHPEMSKGGSCGLCVVASTMVYTRANLRPIHDRCNCEVVPITVANDPGDSLNQLDLGDLYQAAGESNRSAPLKRVRVNAEGVITQRRKVPQEVDRAKVLAQIRELQKQPPSATRTRQIRRLRDTIQRPRLVS